MGERVILREWRVQGSVLVACAGDAALLLRVVVARVGHGGRRGEVTQVACVAVEWESTSRKHEPVRLEMQVAVEWSAAAMREGAAEPRSPRRGSAKGDEGESGGGSLQVRRGLGSAGILDEVNGVQLSP